MEELLTMSLSLLRNFFVMAMKMAFQTVPTPRTMQPTAGIGEMPEWHAQVRIYVCMYRCNVHTCILACVHYLCTYVMYILAYRHVYITYVHM